MESGAVIKDFDVIEDGGASLGESGEPPVVNQFVFETAKEALDKSVVVAVAFAAHAALEAVGRHQKQASPIGADLRKRKPDRLLTSNGRGLGVPFRSVRGTSL